MPYLSIDHLKMGIYRADPDCGFTPMDSDEAIGEKLWPILKGIIMTNIENEQKLIIEGCYILPRFIQDFEPEYSNQIISVFLGFSTKYIQENFTSGILKHRHAVENRGGPEERSIEQFTQEHEVFRKQSAEHGVDYFEIENDYVDELAKVYDFIKEQLEK